MKGGKGGKLDAGRSCGVATAEEEVASLGSSSDSDPYQRSEEDQEEKRKQTTKRSKANLTIKQRRAIIKQ
jgi:hypothetical protein